MKPELYGDFERRVKIGSRVYAENDYAVIEVDSPTHGIHKFLIDQEDMSRCAETTWCVLRVKKKTGYEVFYCQTNVVRWESERMLHRYLLDAPSDMCVDHINFDTHDNRKSNIRLCSYMENNRHRRLFKKNKHGTPGVFYVEQTGKWRAYTMVRRKYHNFGEYENYDDAVAARKKFEDEVFKEYSGDYMGE